MKILLTGGGSGGPVMPLIAVQQKINSEFPETEFLFIGTKNGPESEMVAKYHLPFVAISAGKWRRYFTIKNLLTPFQVFNGFVKATSIIKTFQPDVIFAAGGFVSVPVILAGWLLRKKIVIHQQDVQPSLTNQLVAPLATKITVTFESSLKDFRISSGFFLTPVNSKTGNEKIIWTGNPVREELLHPKKDLKEMKKDFNIDDNQLVILFLGGGTGAAALNQILFEALPELVKFSHIIHSTGKGKGIDFKNPGYHPYELISNMNEAYAVADIVISRAGLSTITELIALKKVSIIIPMPNSHQESNATILNINDAAICFDQDKLNAETLISIIRKIMYDAQWQKQLKDNLQKIMPIDATARISKIILSLCQ
ncbi:MAG: murG [Candidatus Doudnabacteria bacterium]|nr:murG [Candidatus Doudnabacteria bacterium]